MLLLGPIAGYSREFLQPRKLPPMYSRAVARMKFGKYSEAEWEIIKELENWEDDFDGWMMLAELYANHFNNLVEAEQTVLDLCAQPATAAPQVAVALHRLADWHLKLAQNPDAARRTLLLICERFPGTHLAHMAQLRIDQLPASAAELREQKSARPIPLPALGDQMDEPVSDEPINRAQAAKDANALVEQLQQNPNNITAREKLARVLTERLEKPQLGIEQLELLLGISDRSDAERAAWLGLMAAWYLKYLHDKENGRKTLERLTTEYPNTIQAFAARRRLRGLASPSASQQD
jgi:TolA-binding protein